MKRELQTILELEVVKGISAYRKCFPRGDVRYLRTLRETVDTLTERQHSACECAIYILDAIASVECEGQRILTYRLGSSAVAGGVYLNDTQGVLFWRKGSSGGCEINSQSFFSFFGEIAVVGSNSQSVDFEISEGAYRGFYSYALPTGVSVTFAVVERERLLAESVRTLLSRAKSDTDYVVFIEGVLNAYRERHFLRL
jgi:hypothetical protein